MKRRSFIKRLSFGVFGVAAAWYAPGVLAAVEPVEMEWVNLRTAWFPADGVLLHFVEGVAVRRDELGRGNPPPFHMFDIAPAEVVMKPTKSERTFEVVWKRAVQ